MLPRVIAGEYRTSVRSMLDVRVRAGGGQIFEPFPPQRRGHHQGCPRTDY